VQLLHYKSSSITYSECVFVVLDTSREFACPILPSVASPLLLNFPNYLQNGAIFECKLSNVKFIFWFSLQLFNEISLILRKFGEMWSEMYIGLHVNTGFSCPIVMELEFSRQFFEKCSNIKFYADPSSGSRVAPRGLTDGRTDIWWN